MKKLAILKAIEDETEMYVSGHSGSACVILGDGEYVTWVKFRRQPKKGWRVRIVSTGNEAWCSSRDIVSTWLEHVRRKAEDAQAKAVRRAAEQERIASAETLKDRASRALSRIGIDGVRTAHWRLAGTSCLVNGEHRFDDTAVMSLSRADLLKLLEHMEAQQ